MANTINGELVIFKNELRVKFRTKKGNWSDPTPFNLDQLHSTLAIKSKDALIGTQVELELSAVGAKPQRIRPAGTTWDQQPISTEITVPEPHTQSSRGDFHNPYNFIPAIRRDHLLDHYKDESHKKYLLSDSRPSGHGIYYNNLWSGTIAVTLTVVTPLLISDASKVQEAENKHKIYPIRLDSEGRPFLPPTSIKGMLRSAYEAVTNSRMGIFQNHESRLAYRMQATEGLSLVPARIEGQCERIQLLLGTTKDLPEWNQDRNRWDIPTRLMYAAWLPQYTKNSDRRNLDAPRLAGMQHGQRVSVWLQKVERNPFYYWIVCDIASSTASLPAQPTLPKLSGKRHRLLGESLRLDEAYLCITNHNIENKYNERVFFIDSKQKEKWTIYLNKTESERLRCAWKELIENYQEEHKQEIEAGSQRPSQATCGKWSRHITGSNVKSQAEEAILDDGTLCYARVEGEGENLTVLELYPVMIARKLFESSPSSLLPKSLKPASELDELSPADRVFGWVDQDGNGSYRGQLRIHSVQCLSDDAIERFTRNPEDDPGLPLTILGQPKSQQSRFYVSSNPQNGDPLPTGTLKQDGYQPKQQGLRGRKVYPHHKKIAHNADYWNDAMSDRTDTSISGYYQEYRRPKKQGNEQRDSQNRSIQAWVKPNTPFQFEIDVINLSDVELGALLWLLQLPDDHYHRLGGGKPLGFGSIQLAINWEKTDLRTGHQWKTYYESLIPTENSSPREAENCIQKFENEVGRIYGKEAEGYSFEAVRFIQAFRQAAKGLELPIHYPRLRPQPDPEGENFKWFTTNEAGEKRSLPPLWNEQGLPYSEPQ